VGQRIKRDRETKGWSQLQLANALGDVGGPSYSNRISLWENGSLPSEENRRRLASVLGVPVNRYFDWDQPDDPDNDEDEPRAA